jgi:hypothetical protein
MFDKLKRALGDDPVPSGVAAWLKPVRKQSPELAGLVGGFVARGDGAGSVLALGPDSLGLIDQADVGYWSRGLKKLRDGTKMRPDQWVRLGEVLALTPTYAGKGRPGGPPTWFLALQDALWRAMASPLHWAPGHVEAVLAAGGVPVERRPREFVAGFFAVLGGAAIWRDPFSSWRAGPPQPGAKAVVDYVGAHLDAVADALAGLGAEQRLAGLRWLELFPDLAAGLAPTLGLCSVGSSRPVREVALRLVATLPDAVLRRTMADAVDQGAPATVGDAIDFLARVGDRGGRAVIEAALAQGRGGKRDALLATALGRIKAVTGGGPELFLPPMPPLDARPLGDDFVRDLEAAANRAVASLEREGERPEARWARKRAADLKGLGAGDFEAARAWLSGERTKPSFLKREGHVLLAGLDLPLLPAVRASVDLGRRTPLGGYDLNRLVELGHDLRAIVAAAQVAGVADPVGAVADLGVNFGRRADPELIWPFYAEHPELVDQWFGFAPGPRLTWNVRGDPVAVGLRLLGMFPQIPARHLPVVAQLACGEAKTNRRAAQKLLERRPDCLNLALTALGDPTAQVRAAAAAWIGRLGDPAAVEPLRQALAQERGEQAQAAMLAALRDLGDDLSARLTPEALGAKAAKGLKGKPPAGLSWFPLDALPACRWADGTPVDPVVVRWWAVLAAKLKDPGGVGLIPLYVSLLDKASRETLGAFALDAWVAQDVAHPDDAACRAHAAATVDARHAEYQRQAKRWPEEYAALGAMTRDHVFEELRRERAAEYLGSVIGQKGLLALSAGAPGHHVLAVCQRYVRDHGARRAQVEALVTAAASNPDPSAIQFVLSAARKSKQETVRLKAVELARDIADKRGWTTDELADRTIPTAGFDEDGVLRLDYGRRRFEGRVARSPKTGAFTVDLFGADGKPVKALPKPAQADDQELAGQARKQLAVSKRELAQVAKLQEARLFEAMCVGRQWDVPAWRDFLAGHPVMRPLIATLVWQATWPSPACGARAASTPGPSGRRLFRPTPEGELLDAADDAVDLPDDGQVALAHLATVTPAEADAWRAHLRDYGVAPLFGQFDAAAPAVAEGAEQVDDHRGWLSDTFAIRSRATKRGYSRAAAEDGAWFREYFKDMTSADIRVCLGFTGSFLPEEEFGAAVTELSFERDGRRLRLAQVPPILLAETYADYVFVAEAGEFDPKWEVKSGY